MASTDVKIKFIGDAKDLEKALKGLDKDLLSVGETAEKSGAGFGAFAKKAGLGLGAVAVGGVALGVSMFELGNKLDIMKKKAETVFEDSLPMVTQWATKSAALMGLTKNEATGLAAGFADLLKPMGFTAAEAAKMSVEVVGLSGALAAWSGGTKTADEVTQSLAKAMLGEREELKSLGISITENDVSQRLLKNGTNELTGAALEQAKAIATQQLIIEKSTDAQQAWNERQFTGQEVSNQLKVKFKELQEELAIKLYPMLVDLGMWMLNVGIPKMEEIAGKVAAWWEKQEGLRDAIQKGAEMLVAFTENVIRLVGWVADAIEKIDQLAKKMNSLPDKVFGVPLGLPGSGDSESVRSEYERRFGGGRASGGPVMAGHAYTVGENGRETLVMGGRSGNIIPNGGGGQQVIVLQVDGRTAVQWLVDYSRDVGGLPITTRSPS